MWGFWEDSMSSEDAYIVDSNWTLNAAGVRYEAIMDEWTTNDSEITDSNGNAGFRGFYGTYSVTLTPDGANSIIRTIELIPGGPNEFTIELAPNTCQEVKSLGYRLTSDLDGDCLLDYADLLLLVNQWLSTNPVTIPPNYSPDIYSDDKVNLFDFAALSTEWLTCNNPQDANCLQNW